MDNTSSTGGVYWIGADGNVYAKSPTFEGVKNWGAPNADNPMIDVINGYTRIDDPNAPAPDVKETDPELNNNLAYIDSQSALLRDMLARIPTTRQQATTQLEDSYNKEVSDANTKRGYALEDFDMKTQDTRRGKDRAIGAVDTNARTLSNSLQRILGMASGRGSSAYKLAMPNAVARQASGQRTGVLENYGQNFRNIDVAKRRADADFGTLLSNLANDRSNKMMQLEQGLLGQDQEIQGQLADLARNKAALQGGSYSQITAAGDPYAAQIRDRQSQIDQLFNTYRTPYSVKPVTVQTPQLSNYTVDKAAINAGPTSMQYSPYAQFLKKQQEDDQRLG